jgi:hypothetical protein
LENPTTQDQLKQLIEQARINGDTAQKIAHHLDEWGDKHFDRRFVNSLKPKLGDDYGVGYHKYLDESWHLTVVHRSQRSSEGVGLWLDDPPTAMFCRAMLAPYLEGVESSLAKAAMFELAHLDDIREEATRIKADIKGWRNGTAPMTAS